MGLNRRLCEPCAGDGCVECGHTGWIETNRRGEDMPPPRLPSSVPDGYPNLPSSAAVSPIVKTPTRPHSGTMPNPATTIPEKYQVHVMFDDVIKKIGSPVLSLTEALIVCDVYPDVHMTCFGTEFAGDFFLVNLTNGELYVFTSMPERPPHWELSK